MKVKEFRESIGITQGELAELSGLDQRWIRKVESGEIKIENITVTNMTKLLKGMSSAANGKDCEDRILEDFQYMKNAYFVMKTLLED